jgi:hypothetical protein
MLGMCGTYITVKLRSKFFGKIVILYSVATLTLHMLGTWVAYAIASQAVAY